MLEIEFKNVNRYLPKFSTRVNKMKNLILLIIVLLTLLLIGCEKKGRDMYPGYVGEKKDGVPHGQGTKTSENETYIGKWRNGLQHGKGVLTKSDGSNYDGGWVFGKQNGQGTYTFTDGSKYDGELRNGIAWNVRKFNKNGEKIGTIVKGKDSEAEPPPAPEPVAETSSSRPLIVQSYINFDSNKGKPKGLIVFPVQGWVNDKDKIPVKGGQMVHLLKKNGASFQPVFEKAKFMIMNFKFGMLVIELKPGEYKIDKIDTNLFNAKCNCFENFKMKYNKTNFKVENETAHITPYTITSLTYTDNPKNNKTFLTATENGLKRDIRFYLINVLLKKNYDKSWKVM